MSSSDEPAPASRKSNSLSEPEFLAQPSPESNAAPEPSESTSFSELPTPSESPSRVSSFRRAQEQWTTINSRFVPPPAITNSSTQRPFSTPSTKPPGRRSSDTAAQDGRRWRVRFHREPAKIVAAYDGHDPAFRPTLRELIDALATNPKQFEKKRGKLKDCRAVDVTFRDGVVWRAVFVVDESARDVKVLAFGPHDGAYADAMRRL
jgi:hypothetical protein